MLITIIPIKEKKWNLIEYFFDYNEINDSRIKKINKLNYCKQMD